MVDLDAPPLWEQAPMSIMWGLSSVKIDI
jgi:hypothetical protein